MLFSVANDMKNAAFSHAKTCVSGFCVAEGGGAYYISPARHIYKGVGKTRTARPWTKTKGKGQKKLGYALMVSLLAGLFTAVGGALALLAPPKPAVVAAGMGFAGGVMVTVSLADMLPEAFDAYCRTATPFAAAGKAISLFGLGAVAAVLLEGCLPDEKQLLARGGLAGGDSLHAAALRSALVTVAVVVLHNLPEGILTLFTSYADRRLGMTVALAIGMHNLPEGIVIAAPVLYATGKRGRAFWAALLSGLAEPAGAVLAFFCFQKVLTPLFLNGLLCVVAGMMCAVSWFELLELGYRAHQSKACAWGALFGCAVMSLGIYCLA